MPVVTEKLVFYHMPRTGGEWVREVLKDSCPHFEEVDGRHNIVLSNHRAPYRGKLSFTVLRNVLPWLRSWYRFSYGISDRHTIMQGVPECLLFRSAPRGCFDEYVQYFLDRPWLIMGAYRMYGVGVDRILRTETLGADMARMMSDVTGSSGISPEKSNQIEDVATFHKHDVTLSGEMEAKVRGLELQVFASLE